MSPNLSESSGNGHETSKATPSSIHPDNSPGTVNPVTGHTGAPDDEIHVGAGGRLIVPREEIGQEADVGNELDLIKLRKKKLRKPDRREWFALNQESELTTHFLIHKPKADGIETEYYFVNPNLRSAIRDELKPIRIFLFFSFTTNDFGLWPITVTLGNSWYESIVPLFASPSDFFVDNELRVRSDKPNSIYRVRYRPIRNSVEWPGRDTQELLGEALGEDRFIRDSSHELYQDLIDGVEL